MRYPDHPSADLAAAYAREEEAARVWAALEPRAREIVREEFLRSNTDVVDCWVEALYSAPIAAEQLCAHLVAGDFAASAELCAWLLSAAIENYLHSDHGQRRIADTVWALHHQRR